MSQAERSRRFRKRDKAGLKILSFEDDPFSTAEALIAIDLLTPEETADPHKIRVAAARVWAKWKQSVLRNALRDAGEKSV